MLGQDPDPYGAVPPYRIGYDTYTPNYPGIPGVVNSFANAPAGTFGGGPAGTGTFGHAIQPYNAMLTYDMGTGGYSTTPTAAQSAMNPNQMYGSYGYGLPVHNSMEAGQFANPYNTSYWPSEAVAVNRPPPAPSMSAEEQRARAALNVGRPPGTPRGPSFGDGLGPTNVPTDQHPFGRALARPPQRSLPTADRTTGGFGEPEDVGVSRFVPYSKQTAWTQTLPSFGQAYPAFRGSPPQMRFDAPFGAPGSENDGKAKIMASYLESMQSQENKHADAMSRER